jgi:hypothetical protein
MREAINPFHLKLLLSCSLQIFWAEILRVSVSITGETRKSQQRRRFKTWQVAEKPQWPQRLRGTDISRTRNGCFAYDFRSSLVGFSLCLCDSVASFFLFQQPVRRSQPHDTRPKRDANGCLSLLRWRRPPHNPEYAARHFRRLSLRLRALRARLR